MSATKIGGYREFARKYGVACHFHYLVGPLARQFCALGANQDARNAIAALSNDVVAKGSYPWKLYNGTNVTWFMLIYSRNPSKSTLSSPNTLAILVDRYLFGTFSLINQTLTPSLVSVL